MTDELERRAREKLLATKNLTQKIQFNPEYIGHIEHFFGLPIDKRIVLLHSVRGAEDKEPEFITKYIEKQEAKGNAVYIPKKFNFQDDTTGGIAICNTMRYVIQNSGLAAIGYNPNSEGTKFDFGICRYNAINTILLNLGSDWDDPIYRFLSKDKSKSTGIDSSVARTFDRIWDAEEKSNNKVEICFDYVPREGKPPALNPHTALEFGMIYASEQPFTIVNLKEVQAQSDLEDKLKYFKSYSKVALKLHEIYNGI